MHHCGCPEFYFDRLHSNFTFFVSIFFAVINVVTFILNVGYIVEERENKTKVSNDYVKEYWERVFDVQL